MSLDDTLSKILGVTEPPKTAIASAYESSDYCPERPEPLYEYRIDVYRSEYGSAVIRALSEADAKDILSSAEIDWNDYGDWEVNDVEQETDEPVNEDEIAEWDEEYGDKYDPDGQPKCSDCGHNYPAKDLHKNPSGTRWYCDSCAADNL